MSEQPTPYLLMPLQPAPTELYQRPSATGETRTKRARASRPKVKSGCITCKACRPLCQNTSRSTSNKFCLTKIARADKYKTRRVKCDETKPQCLRCQKFGRVCDGYPEHKSGKGVAVIPIQPRIPSVSIYTPSVCLHATEEESRYFQQFSERSAYELSGFFDPSFWTQLVLQESHVVAPIRHAVIAIGALNKSLESAPGPDLKVNIIQSIDKKHHEYAVLQYLKAIQALNNYISASESPQLRTALLACMLFICFETFQGSYASSIQQTYGGLKILRSYYVGKPGSKPWIPESPLPESLKRTVLTRNIKATLLSRTGCDSVSKARAIAMHIEEYLGNESKPKSGSDGSLTSITDAFFYGPGVEQELISPKNMTATDPQKELQRIVMSVPSADRSTCHTKDFLRTQVLETAAVTTEHRDNKSRQSSKSPPTSTRGAGQGSSTLSNSISSTPASYSSPSTDPHTPSPSYAAPSQALSTSHKLTLASRSPTPPPLQNDIKVEEILIQTFARVDGQCLFFGLTPGIPPLIWDIHKVWHLPIPPSFQDFRSAQRCWDFLMDRALQFYRRTLFNRAYAPDLLDSPDQIAREHTSYLQQLSAFEKAYQPILDIAIDGHGKLSDPAAVVLSLYPKITAITLACVPYDSEMVYDAFLSDFTYITRTCALLIASCSSSQTPRNSRFSFEIGVVPPLHVTATKCRDPIVRREAVNLLFSSPRQEGMWDGVLTARIGKWIISCEEDGLGPPPIISSGDLNLSQSPGRSLVGSRFSYQSPPQLVDDLASVGTWENGGRMSSALNNGIPGGDLHEYDGGHLVNAAELLPNFSISELKNGVAKGKQKDTDAMGWMVPEKNRVRLLLVDFHIPDRYIKLKCRKALTSEDGRREERETVLAW